jgi:hypothetical protein
VIIVSQISNTYLIRGKIYSIHGYRACALCMCRAQSGIEWVNYEWRIYSTFLAFFVVESSHLKNTVNITAYKKYCKYWIIRFKYILETPHQAAISLTYQHRSDMIFFRGTCCLYYLIFLKQRNASSWNLDTFKGIVRLVLPWPDKVLCVESPEAHIVYVEHDLTLFYVCGSGGSSPNTL